MEPRALYVLGKYLATKYIPHPNPTFTLSVCVFLREKGLPLKQEVCILSSRFMQICPKMSFTHFYFYNLRSNTRLCLK